MCHDPDTRPPSAPGALQAVSSEPTHLTSRDGTRLMAHIARPAHPTGTGVVILPDFRGLHDYYRSLAERFAETGVTAIAIDYFGRSLEDGPRGEGVETMHLLQELRPEVVALDARAAFDLLLSGEVGPIASVFAVGFCFGGSQAWILSALEERLSGAIGFYGRPDDARSYVPRMRAPLLVIAAGDDFLTPEADARRFDEELTHAGVEHRFVLYPGVPHSFFDGASGEYEDTCAAAWREVLAFIDERGAR